MSATVRSILIVAAFAFGWNPLLSGQTSADFRTANDAYQQKDYQLAADTYENILAEGKHSAALYYNLGNAYYQLGKIGRAVLNYERALKLDPNDQQVQKNLRLANQQLQDAQVVIQQSSVVELWYNIQNQLSGRAWSWIGLIMLWAGIGGLAIWLGGKQRKWKKRGFIGGLSILTLCILPFLFAYGSEQNRFYSNEAIIMASETELKAGPEEESKTIQLLHEGTKVIIIDQIGSWNRVELTDTSEGWLPSDVTVRI
jgi:tetratricopeptide (TPR) repeat protein